MGKASRDKGGRVERCLRDHLAFVGFQSGRIPLSGAMAGFPGDVYGVHQEFGRVLFECKARAKGFENIYKLLDELPVGALLKVRHNDADVRDALFEVSYDVQAILRPDHAAYTPIADQRLSKKMYAMRKWLGAANVLAIKKDWKPFLFLRFL